MSDEKFDLRNLVRVPADGALDAIRMAMLPNSGLVCPKCGVEAKRLPNGQPSNSTWWLDAEGKAASAFYHDKCVAEVIAERDVAYIREHLAPWTPKEELEADAPSS